MGTEPDVKSKPVLYLEHHLVAGVRQQSGILNILLLPFSSPRDQETHGNLLFTTLTVLSFMPDSKTTLPKINIPQK